MADRRIKGREMTIKKGQRDKSGGSSEWRPDGDLMEKEVREGHKGFDGERGGGAVRGHGGLEDQRQTIEDKKRRRGKSGKIQIDSIQKFDREERARRKAIAKEKKPERNPRREVARLPRLPDPFLCSPSLSASPPFSLRLTSLTLSLPLLLCPPHLLFPLLLLIFSSWVSGIQAAASELGYE